MKELFVCERYEARTFGSAALVKRCRSTSAASELKECHCCKNRVVVRLKPDVRYEIVEIFQGGVFMFSSACGNAQMCGMKIFESIPPKLERDTGTTSP